jgi:hypothetical protein
MHFSVASEIINSQEFASQVFVGFSDRTVGNVTTEPSHISFRRPQFNAHSRNPSSQTDDRNMETRVTQPPIDHVILRHCEGFVV